MVLTAVAQTPWNKPLKVPAHMSRNVERAEIVIFAKASNFSKPDAWLAELQSTLTRLSKEVNHADVSRLVSMESALLHNLVKQGPNMRSEKFYPKLNQASRALIKFQRFSCCKYVENIACIIPPVKPAVQVISHRLPTGAMFRQLLLQLLRGHGCLLQVVHYCEEAAVWLELKMRLGQRSVMSLTLFAVVARVRALSLYLINCIQDGYAKLYNILPGVTTKLLPSGPSKSAILPVLHELPATLPTLHQNMANTKIVDCEELEAENFLRNLSDSSSNKKNKSTIILIPVVGPTFSGTAAGSTATSSKSTTCSSAIESCLDEDMGELVCREEIISASKSQKEVKKKKVKLAKKPSVIGKQHGTANKPIDKQSSIVKKIKSAPVNELIYQQSSPVTMKKKLKRKLSLQLPTDRITHVASSATKKLKLMKEGLGRSANDIASFVDVCNRPDATENTSYVKTESAAGVVIGKDKYDPLAKLNKICHKKLQLKGKLKKSKKYIDSVSEESEVNLQTIKEDPLAKLYRVGQKTSILESTLKAKVSNGIKVEFKENINSKKRALMRSWSNVNSLPQCFKDNKITKKTKSNASELGKKSKMKNCQ